MRLASSAALFTCNGAVPKSSWALGVVLAGLLVLGLPPRALRADTTLDSGTTTVSSGTNFGGILTVGFTGTAALEVIAGGYATNSAGYLGYFAGSDGTATVSSGTWANGGNLVVGINGIGTLNVTGGSVTSSFGFIGSGAGSVGTATVSSGTWANGVDLTVGNNGTGTLNVNGGSVTNLNAYLGGNGSTAFATVSSGTWANSGDIFLGPLGSHSEVTHVELNITGGLVTSVNCAYGLGTFAVTTVSGGTWANSGNLSITGDLNGRLNVTGGLVTNVNATIGMFGNTVTVSSGTWANSGDLVVNGPLNVTGGLVTNVNATTGGISNVVSVSGGTWANSGNLTVGDTTITMMNGGLVSVSGTLSVPAGSFPGTIDLRSGGTLQIGVGGTTGVLDVSTLTNNGTLIFNRSDDSTFSGIISGTGAVTKQGGGTLTLTGTSASPNAIVMDRALNVQAGVLAILASGAGDLYVGNTGTGTLNVNGGSVTNLNAYLGGNGSTAFATVSSGTWANSGDIFLGTLGSHSEVTNVELNITGGLVTSVNCAYGLGTFAVTTVSGGTWANSGNLSIAGYVYGRLNVTGGLVTNVNATIGTSDNTVTVSSGTWANSGDLVVNGSLNVTGGLVTNVNATTGGISNVVSVSSGTWANSGNLTVGDSTIRVMNGGLVSVSGTLLVPAGSFPGSIDLRSGGTIQIGVGGTSGVLGVSTLTNNGTLIFNRTDASTYSGSISGTGAVTKQGGGTLTLDGANSYSGVTTISGGVLALSGTGSIGTGDLNLGSSGVFDLTTLASGTYSLPSTGDLIGSGTLTGNGHTLAVLGSFLPGNSPGTITLDTGFTLDLSGATSTTFEITDPLFTAGTYDLVNGNGSMIFGGILNLAFSGTFADGTDVLQLFSNTGGFSGDFASVVSTGLAAGQFATFNATTGSISVVPEPSTYAMALAGLACGGWQMWRRRRRRRQAPTLAA